jgi:hypothetical protein
MIHVMHDLETWALSSPIPVLVSLGAVKFDGEKIIDRFHVGVDPADCQRFGLEMEAGTVDWWMHDDRKPARDQLVEIGRVDLYAALDVFSMWVQQTEKDQLGSVWSNGSSFDNAKLANIYRKIGIEWPFKHNQEECYRTMKNRWPDVPFTRIGTHHGALDDAESQAMHLMLIAAEAGIKL